jgi:hypothetical protein
MELSVGWWFLGLVAIDRSQNLKQGRSLKNQEREALEV